MDEIRVPSWVHYLTGWNGADLSARARLLEALCAHVKPTSIISNSLTLVILVGLIIARTRNPAHVVWLVVVILAGFLPRLYAARLRRSARFGLNTDAKALGFLVISALYGLIWGAGAFLILPSVSGTATGIFLFVVVFGTIMGPYAAMPGILYVRLATTGAATLVAVALYTNATITLTCCVIAAWLVLRTDVWRSYHRALRRELEQRAQLQGRFQSTQAHNRQLRAIANTDSLTGAFNRRALMDWLEKLLLPAALVIIDVDHFKTVNDNYGHHAGDAILIELVRRLHSAVRKQDLVARIGGEEFVVLLQDTDRQEALSLVERLHARISNQVIRAGGHEVRLTISVGVTVITRASADLSSSLDFLRSADEALYEAKRQGRNRVSVAQTPVNVSD